MWQLVDGTSHKFFVYSAYYDGRDTYRPVVKVVGVTHTRHSDDVYCRMYFKDGPDSVKVRHVKATVSIIRENWNLRKALFMNGMGHWHFLKSLSPNYVILRNRI